MRGLKLAIVFGALIFIGAIFVAWFAYFSVNPGDTAQINVEVGRPLPIDQPLVINFAKPVSRKTLGITTTPYVEGRVEFKDPVVGSHFFKTAVFVPLYSWQPEKTYIVNVTGIKSVAALTSSGEQNKTFNFFTSPVAKILDVNVGGSVRGTTTKPEIKITFDKVPDFTEIKIVSSPAVEWSSTIVDAGLALMLHPLVTLEKGTEYDLRIMGSVVLKNTDGSVRYKGGEWIMYQGAFKTAPPPQIISWVPNGTGVKTNEPIVIEFDGAVENCNQVGASTGGANSISKIITIIPETAGGLVWSNNCSVLTFAPAGFWKHDTTYRIIIAQGLSGKNFGVMPAGTGFYFRTMGPVKISSIYPDNGSVGVDVTSNVSITFNQAVDYKSVQEKFSLLSGDKKTEGTFTFKEKTMEFKPVAPLEYGKDYKIVLQKGVASYGGGLPSVELFDVPFKTQDRTVLINIKFDHQDHALSCEAAALKMALSFYDVSVEEKEIIDAIGFDPTPHTGNIWGDPDVAFVGSIDGQQNKTGYGVHWGPVASAGSKWRPSVAFTGWEITDLVKEIVNGHPVIIWGVLPKATRSVWETVGGKKIEVWKGEHTFVVVGFVGSASNPEKIVTIDPINNKKYWSKEDFINTWLAFGNSGVVVK